MGCNFTSLVYVWLSSNYVGCIVKFIFFFGIGLSVFLNLLEADCAPELSLGVLGISLVCGLMGLYVAGIQCGRNLDDESHLFRVLPS